MRCTPNQSPPDDPSRYSALRRCMRPLIEQAARHGISESAAWRWARNGLPTVRMGRHTLVHDMVMDRYAACLATGETFVAPTAAELVEHAHAQEREDRHAQVAA